MTPPAPAYIIREQRILAEAPGVRLRRMTLAAGQSIPPHRHAQVTDIWCVLSGRVRLMVEGRPDALLEPGQAESVEPGVVHALENPGPDEAVVLLWQGCGGYDFQPA